MVNHLNQEKATLIEKYEHYEREVPQKTSTSRPGSVMAEINSNKLQINRLLASSPLRNSIDKSKLLGSPTKSASNTVRSSESPIKRNTESPRIITPTLHKKPQEQQKSTKKSEEIDISDSNYETNFKRNT